MKEQITYQPFEDSDSEPLIKMCKKLWKKFDEEDLQKLLVQMGQKSKQKILLAKTTNNKNVGFAIFSIRIDYVEGAEKTPTGYLEGIFVEPEYRKMGMAKEFVRLGEKWCKKNGCSQIGSDTWLTDTESRKFHKSVGFWEEDELVHFLKNIK